MLRIRHTFVGSPQEEGMMSILQVFAQYETKVIEPVGDESASEGVNGATKVDGV